MKEQILAQKMHTEICIKLPSFIFHNFLKKVKFSAKPAPPQGKFGTYVGQVKHLDAFE